MKKTAFLYLASIIFLLASCDIIDRSDTKRIYFHINNVGKSSWEDLIIYATDPNGIFVDSTYQRGYLPGHRSTISIEIHKLQHIESGLFEIKATAANGKLIVHEFGNINKPKKEEEYQIELKDSTIFIF